jgi:hypothetical protein
VRPERSSGEPGLNQATLAFVALLAIVSGCRARAGEVGPEECKPTSGTLPAGATADGIGGEYRLTLVADQGPKQGRAVSGQLWLEPYEGQLRQRTRPDGSPDSATVYAAFGATDVEVTEVGAVRLGSTESRDPSRPGVLVLERHTASPDPVTQITLRLGSDANRRDQVRFDGGYTALYVREISGERLAGDWASSAGRSQETRGHFCATRAARR